MHFDYNSTSAMADIAIAEWRSASQTSWYNPSGPYRNALRVNVLLENAREKLAKKLNIDSEDLIFNSGGTEGNNSVFNYIKCLYPAGKVAILSIEHSSVFLPATHYFKENCILIPVKTDGVIDIEKLIDILNTQEIHLVSVMAASSETGVVQPWKEIAKICNERGVLYHCDAVAWIGKMPCGHFENCDFVTASAHKFCGPKGMGFMKVSKKSQGYRSLFGGGQEAGRRAGTVDYPSVAATVVALDEVDRELSSITDEGKLHFEKLLKEFVPGVDIVGESSKRLWNTTLALMPKCGNMDWVRLLDAEGFQVSTGHSCASLKNVPSRILDEMGVLPEKARRSIRISGGWDTTKADWIALAKSFLVVWGKLNTSNAAAGVIDVD